MIMTLLDLLQQKATYRRSGSRYVGPCPKCGGSDSTTRFVTQSGSETGKCFSCGWGCDIIGYLRGIDGMSCREAFAHLGRNCERTDCPSHDKCHGAPARKKSTAATVSVPAAPRVDRPEPAAPRTPAELWQTEASQLVDQAHAAILGNRQALQYLSARGLDLAAVKKYRLGWQAGENGKNCIFRPRSAWGLQPKQRENSPPSNVLWIPRGITIPTIIDGRIDRIRIRRPNGDLGPEDAKYIAIEGGGSHVPSLNPSARAQIAIESDLDALLVDHLAGDIIGAIPLTTVTVMPNGQSDDACRRAVVILVALDFDFPRRNERTGRLETPGANAWQRWQARYPQAERWPVPAGKDPGEAWQAGVDLREWVLAGLPVSLHPKVEAGSRADCSGDAAETAGSPPAGGAPAAPLATSRPADLTATVTRVTAKDGREIAITDNRDEYRRLARNGTIVFTGAEIALVKTFGPSPGDATALLDIKAALGPVFGGGIIESITPPLNAKSNRTCYWKERIAS